jgi:hypothetical protein
MDEEEENNSSSNKHNNKAIEEGNKKGRGWEENRGEEGEWKNK